MRATTIRILVVLLGIVTTVQVANSSGDKCEAGKLKAAAKKASSVLSAYAKNALSPNNAQLSASLDKADSKLSAAFTKAEMGGTCDITGDAPNVSTAIDVLVAQLLRPTAMTYTGEPVATVLGPTTITGSLDVDPLTGDLTGEVTVRYGSGGSAIISGIPGGLQLQVGTTTLLILRNATTVLLNGVPTDYADLLATTAANAAASADPAQWSPEAQASFALAALTSTPSWRAMGEGSGQARSVRSAGSPSWQCKAKAYAGSAVATIAPATVCGVELAAWCGPGAPYCLAATGAVCAAVVGGAVGPTAYELLLSTCTPVCEPNSLLACYPGDPATRGVGACRDGQMTCKADGSGYGACGSFVAPTPEICDDHVDNDCNGSTDSSDAACGGPAAGGSGFPDTGQAAIWNFGDDGTYFTGCQPSYTDNGDGTVTDNCTGLVWAQTEGTSDTWPRAIDECEALTLGGSTNWRLPNVRELESIMVYGIPDYAVDPVFPLVGNYFWSSTTLPSALNYAWMVSSVDGSTSQYPKTSALHVRCVRGTSSVLAETGVSIATYPGEDSYYTTGCTLGYTDLGDGTVLDNCTGLTWEQVGSAGGNWYSELDRCSALTLAGHLDWRLANIRELLSLVDYGRAPTLPSIFDQSSLVAWSSTTHRNNVNYAWFLSYSDGVATNTGKGTTISGSRCVRGGT